MYRHYDALLGQFLYYYCCCCCYYYYYTKRSMLVLERNTAGNEEEEGGRGAGPQVWGEWKDEAVYMNVRDGTEPFDHF